MCYWIEPERLAYDVLEYDEKESIASEYFLEGPRMDVAPIVFTIKKKLFLKWAPSVHIINTLGPVLVSNSFKNIIEETAPGEADFYPATIRDERNTIHGFFGMRPKILAPCYDLERSECEDHPSWLTISDFDFTYVVFAEQVPYDLNIVRCEESPSRIIVSEKVKKACYTYQLKGLVFWKAIDRTPKGRDICEKIK